jgi:AcrR family transcriptional regulator
VTTEVKPAVKPDRMVREPLSRERVLATALEVADAGGIDALSMRRLAQALGVEAMSLYHYAASKDEILDGMVELILRDIELPAADGAWKPAIRAFAISAPQVLRRHPWACNLWMSGPRVLPTRLVMIDAVLGRLADAGLPGDTTDLAYHALDAHILGFTLWEAGYTVGLQDMPSDFTTVVRELGLERYPHLLEHAAYHLDPPPGPRRSAFAFGPDLILDGLGEPVEPT